MARSSYAPLILNIMIDMFMLKWPDAIPGDPSKLPNDQLFPGQHFVQLMLLGIALISVRQTDSSSSRRILKRGTTRRRRRETEDRNRKRGARQREKKGGGRAEEVRIHSLPVCRFL